MRFLRASSVFLFVVAIMIVGLFSEWATPAALAQACVISGTIYRDYNQDGVQQAGVEPVVEGVVVRAFGDNSVQLATDTSDATGQYSLNVPQPRVRVEFTIPAPLNGYLRSSRFGAMNRTTVTFHDCALGDATINFGVSNPGQFCQQNPDLATSCYTIGSQDTGEPAVVSFPYSAGSGGNPDAPPHTNLALDTQVGTTWGLAHHRPTNSIFVAALMKRHAGFGPGGPGAIYRIDVDTGTIVTLTTLPAGADPHPNTAAIDAWVRDANSWDEVGKMSLGDMDISDDGRTLWVVNLNNRRLYRIGVGLQGTLGGTASFAIPTNQADCPNPARDIRPFATAFEDGQVYVGVVCTAESLALGLDPGQITQAMRDALRAYVYRFNPANNQFTQVLNEPLNYPRRCTQRADLADCNGLYDADWQPWRTTFGGFTSQPGNVDFAIVYPQPILSDIEFDNSNMLLAFRDRLGDQTGNNAWNTTAPDQTLYLGIPAGDLLLACPTGPNSWSFENGTTCGAGRAANNEGPGGGELYSQDNLAGQHDELITGGIVQVPGLPDVAVTVFDPLTDPGELFDAGIRWFDNGSGAISQIYRVFDGDFGQVPPVLPLFGKANGLGDLEALCAPAPIEIGNRVWFDENRNGVQDPNANEFPVPGVTVNLYDANGTLVGTTLTDANGEYYFNETNVSNGVGLSPNAQYTIRLNNPLDYEAGGPLFGWTLTNRDRGTDIHDSDGRFIGGFPGLRIRTGDFGENDHTFDFGFFVGPTPTRGGEDDDDESTPGPASVSVFSKQVDPPFSQTGGIVNWIITVFNPTDRSVNNVRITDNVPTGLEILDASATAGTVTWTAQTVTFTIASLGPGQSVTITVRTRVLSNAPFEMNNSAELSSDDWENGLLASARLVLAGQQPETGETPWWRWPLILVVLGASAAAISVGLRRRKAA